MRVRNETDWSTRDLKRVMTATLKQDLDDLRETVDGDETDDLWQTLEDFDPDWEAPEFPGMFG